MTGENGIMDVRVGVRVEGVVQGVGFRPFVHGLATGLGLSGLVGNDAGGVFIEVEGAPDRVGRFLDGLRAHPPRLAVVERVTTRELAAEGPAGGRGGFAIVSSVADALAGGGGAGGHRNGGGPNGDGSNGGGASGEGAVAGPRRALVSADSATCDDCLRELRDPSDRRYGYAFINCTACGPRFTIVTGVPYDRPNTTMAGFAMCERCAAEYADPSDRRFHAQPVCCPACGPSLALRPAAGDPLPAARAMLADGAIVAVKGLGGYHLAARAAD
ncbi:acylphosphatase, partial [Actinomadura roseirufa]|uniref:acylphosphatase n=1 Tax=Actinomadura roseirufa TaxID=2094049 RepID=UPI002795466B